MLLAGVSLAGANAALEEDRDDGILYAIEAKGLNLEGTELVVLSACETEQGVIDYSEGVYGLVRAFRTAGARNVLVTLRPVGDFSTRDFMTAFDLAPLLPSIITRIRWGYGPCGPVGKGEGAEPVEARVGSLGVVVDPPELEGVPGCWQALEQVLVQAFVAQPADQALDQAVLHRLARRDIVPGNAALFLPGKNCMLPTRATAPRASSRRSRPCTSPRTSRRTRPTAARGVVIGHESLGEEAVHRRDRPDPGQAQLLRQPLLQRAEDLLHAAAPAESTTECARFRSYSRARPTWVG